MEKIIQKFKELTPKLENHGEGNHSIRYYKGEELMCVIRCVLKETVGTNKPIRQKYILLNPSETKPLMDYLTEGMDNMDGSELSSTVNKVIYNSVSWYLLNQHK